MLLPLQPQRLLDALAEEIERESVVADKRLEKLDAEVTVDGDVLRGDGEPFAVEGFVPAPSVDEGVVVEIVDGVGIDDVVVAVELLLTCEDGDLGEQLLVAL